MQPLVQLSNDYHAIAGLSRSAFPNELSGEPSSLTLLAYHPSLSKNLGLNIPPEQRAAFCAGQLASQSPEPSCAALAYAGHQFGHYSPLLGDGRAHLLGSFTAANNQRWDIQLKGSGATVFSRGGDGLCAIAPAMREFIMSYAMENLGIPTTRCLGVVATGQTVWRTNSHGQHTAQQGAIVTRLATSHIRVGSFQFLAAQGDKHALQALADLAIKRHFSSPQAQLQQHANPYLALFDAVMEKQIALVVAWMRVGFVHGVMNTDNTLISGDTIDYGPCAMLNNFDVNRSFSSIDSQGRYAFGNQASIMQWNLARFAESLLSIAAPTKDQAVTDLSALLTQFPARFEQQLQQMWAKKLGFVDTPQPDLISELLSLMQQHQLDFTNTFDGLTQWCNGEPLSPSLQQYLGGKGGWLEKWQAVVSAHQQQSYQLMRQVNPRVIPRNHQVEAILSEFEHQGSSDKFVPFLAALQNPYQLQPEHSHLQVPPNDDSHYRTFCGT